MLDSAKLVVSSRFARRTAGITIVSTVVFTLSDFVFKRELLASDPDNLGLVFAKLYLILNLLSLFAQMFLVKRVLRRANISGALALLPVLMAAGGLGIALGGGLMAALMLKGSDGALRHSLHRTASELLFVPLKEPLRSAAKTFIGVVGQRGAQGVTSLLILAAVSWGVADTTYGMIIAGLSALWVAGALAIHKNYLKLMQKTLRDSVGRDESSSTFPREATLSALRAALVRSDDAEVIAAISLLVECGGVQDIPRELLDQASPLVAAEILSQLAQHGDENSDATWVRHAHRLLSDPNGQTQAAALRALLVSDPEITLLLDHVDSDDSSVRATAHVGLLILNHDARRQQSWIAAKLAEKDNPDEAALIAIAKTAGLRHRPALDETLGNLLSPSRPPPVRRAAVEAIAVLGAARFVDDLVPLLAERRLRGITRHTLLAIGPPALERTSEMLSDTTLPARVRRHLPRTVASFGLDAAPALMQRLGQESDNVVYYKLLRGLGRLVQDNPSLTLDAARLLPLLEDTLAELQVLIAWRQTLGAVTEQHTHDALGLLLSLLRNKVEMAFERLFRLLGLRYPNAGFETIHRGLGANNTLVRSSSLELIEGYVDAPLRYAVLKVVELAAQPPGEHVDTDSWSASRVESLKQMAAGEDRSLSELANHALGSRHTGET